MHVQACESAQTYWKTQTRDRHIHEHMQILHDTHALQAKEVVRRLNAALEPGSKGFQRVSCSSGHWATPFGTSARAFRFLSRRPCLHSLLPHFPEFPPFSGPFPGSFRKRNKSRNINNFWGVSSKTRTPCLDPPTSLELNLR